MNTTVNISIPASMYEDTKKLLARRGFTTFSEWIRSLIRKEMYPEITENGFTREFEEEVLRRAAEPVDEDLVWDGKTPFTKFVLSKGKKRHGKG